MKLRFLLLFSFICSGAFAVPAVEECVSITGFRVTNVTPSAATLIWDNMSRAQGYIYVVSKSIVPPDHYGHYIKETEHVETGLGSARTYYAHVRAKCDGGEISEWSTIQFNTPPPQGLNLDYNYVFAVSLLPAQPDKSVTVKVKGSIEGNAVIWLEDISGRLINRYDMTGDAIHIDVSRLVPGIYFICYNDALGRIQWLRFTK